MQVSRRWCEALPKAYQARKATVTLRRVAFARCVGDLMDVAGVELKTKCLVSGSAVEIFSRATVLEHAREFPIPCLFAREKRRVVAMAVLCIAASYEMDYDAERALRGVMSGFLGKALFDETAALVALLLGWLV